MVNSDLIIFELISIVHHGYIYFQFHWFFRQPALYLCSGENTTLFMFTFVQGELYLKSSQTSKMELLEKIWMCYCMYVIWQFWRWIIEISKVCYEETQKNGINKFCLAQWKAACILHNFLNLQGVHSCRSAFLNEGAG